MPNSWLANLDCVLQIRFGDHFGFGDTRLLRSRSQPATASALLRSRVVPDSLSLRLLLALGARSH